METSSDLIKSLNEIKASIDENNLAQWRSEARLTCLKEASRHLKIENERLRRDIQRMKYEVEELEPLIKMIDEMNKESIRTIKNGYESIVHQRLYKRTIESSVKEQRDKYSRIFKEYQDHIDTIMKNLEFSIPKYQLLKEKRIELQLSQIRCMQLKKKTEERRKINRQKLEIRKQLFYTQIVALAKAWVEKRDYLASAKKLEELSNLEREWMIKVMESTEELKQKQRMRNLKDISMTPFELPKNNTFPKSKILDTPVESEEKNPVERGKSVDLYSDIKNFIDNNNVFSQRMEPVNSGISVISNKPTFNSNHSKVVILENKVLKPVGANKEERSKAIEKKLQKVKNTISRNYSQRLVSQKSMLNVSLKIANPSNKTEGRKLTKNDTWTSQNLSLSQENSQFLSQGSEKCSQPIESTKPTNVIHNQVNGRMNMKMTQSANQTLSEMKFIPQHQKSLQTSEVKDICETHAFEKQGFDMKLPENNAMVSNGSQQFVQDAQKILGTPQQQFEQNDQIQGKPVSALNVSQFQGAVKKSNDTMFINQGGFFNTGFNKRNSAPDNRFNQQKKQENFAPFGMDAGPNIFMGTSESTMRLSAKQTPFRTNDVRAHGNKDKDAIDSNQSQDKDANKNNMNFNTNALNFEAPPQFNFGNFSQTVNDSCDYAAGCLSPDYEPNLEGETQANASFFQFTHAGTGGFGLF